ncbi:hypothetical protein GCM10018790_61850 [Kitasatospora xanthocidica]|nr:hypothetical protein GCM10018790_61850 [Kitasatospora xanthocidica]
MLTGSLSPGADCGGSHAWLTGSLAQSNVPLVAVSYRVVPA